jgi:hypothetical protein
MGDSTHQVIQPHAGTVFGQEGPAHQPQENPDSASRAAGAVEGAAASVKEAALNVAQTLDVRRLVQEHPWLAVGGSIALGFVAAEILRAASQPTSGEQASAQESTGAQKAVGELTSWLGGQLNEVKDFAAASIMNYVHSLVTHGVNSLEEQLGQGSATEQRDMPRSQQSTEPPQGGQYPT